MKLMTRPFVFMLAVLYGIAWIAGPVSLLAAVLADGEGRNPFEFLSTIILAFGVIAFIHHRMRWFPFRRNG